jgi:hypothetical protein
VDASLDFGSGVAFWRRLRVAAARDAVFRRAVFALAGFLVVFCAALFAAACFDRPFPFAEVTVAPRDADDRLAMFLPPDRAGACFLDAFFATRDLRPQPCTAGARSRPAGSTT